MNNHEHRHSGIGLHTPASVHDGTATAIRAERTQVLADGLGLVPSPPAQAPSVPDRSL
ncbi:hypothetical protein AB0H12_44695 [Actinosynnema sp. NPDC023794]